MLWQDYISSSSDVRSGKPCIVGTRLTVTDVLEYLAAGMTEAQILAELPALKPEHIRATLAFAAERERRLSAPPFSRPPVRCEHTGAAGDGTEAPP
jgi:uncharacterized protein (DUF433 family)